RSHWRELLGALGPLIELTPDNQGKALLLYESAACRLDQNLDPDLAAPALRTAIELVPPDASTLIRLVDAEDLHGTLDDRVDALQRLLALRSDPLGKAELHTRIGRLQLELEAWEDAAASFRDALSQVSLYAPAFHALRQLLTDLQQFDELVELTDEWSNAPGLTEGARAARKLALAELDTALGRYDEAIEAYRSALAAGFHAPFWGLSRLLQGLQ